MDVDEPKLNDYHVVCFSIYIFNYFLKYFLGYETVSKHSNILNNDAGSRAP